MSFNTIPFLVFLALSVIAYYLVPQKVKNLLLLAASLAFYCFGPTPGFVLFLLCSALITWISGAGIAASKTPRQHRTWLWTGILLPLGILAFFKYNQFFAPQMADWLGQHGYSCAVLSGGAWRLMLPLGISYYTFQSLAYVLDLHRGETSPEKSFINYLLYVSFFPQVTAGPIGRPGELLPQFAAPRRFDYTGFTDGLRLMLIGFFKKIAVADMLSLVLDPVFADPGAYRGLTLMSTVIFYALYLYCDFSGYSDIARGCAALFGIRLRENFDTPYLSASFTELWRRWHMSLSTWLRDYVYIGLLGGNRRGKVRQYLNLFLTFVISGLWHGVGLTYFVWGVLHGILQVVEKWLFTRRLMQLNPTGLRRALHTALVFTLNAWTLTVFRAPSLSVAWAILAGQFSGISLQSYAQQITSLIGQGFNATPLLIAFFALFCTLTTSLVVFSDFYRYRRLQGDCLAVHLGHQRTWVRWLVYYGMLAFILAAFLIRNGNYVGSISFAYGGF